MTSDPTTASIAEQTAECERLRAEVDRLARALIDAYTNVEVLTADNERLRKIVEAAPRETQATISRWAEETFGPAGSNARAVARANREMAELLEHVTSDDQHPEAAEEVADIVIVLYRVASRLGVDLHAEIDAKMSRNRARKWKLDGTGHGYHVEEGP